MKNQSKPNELFDTSFEWSKNLQKAKQELAKASSSYCLAKWAHSTIHFQLGATHSCYNLPMHPIPLDGLDRNPSSLHNTPTKIEQREMMLNGQRPPHCAYCWTIEDLNTKNYSDRIIQSSGDWAYPSANEIYKSKLGETISPRYLEVSFSNLCNFKCSYCSPVHSNLWAEEIKKYGDYPVSTKHLMPLQMLDEESNPYIEAFKKWWPELRKDLKVFRITGGEPLLSKNTWQILEDIKNNPVPKIHLSINSNLGVSDQLIEKLISELKAIIVNKSVQKITIFTSIEATGEQAEYIRYGLRYNKFISNMEKILSQLPEVRISIMSTFCALSIFSYLDLLKVVLDLKNKYSNNITPQRVGISTNYLRYPEHLSAQVLNYSAVEYTNEIFNYMLENKFILNKNENGFTTQELSLFDNLQQWIKVDIGAEKKTFLQNQFEKYFSEYDSRRGTNLTKTFPLLNNLLKGY